MKEFKETVEFNGKADDIFEFLTNPRKFSNITGGKTSNTNKEGKSFTCYDGYINGTIDKLENGKKIVMKWRVEDFDNGHLTNVIIDIKPKTNKSCSLSISQDNIPDDFYEDIKNLWNELYFDPIKDHLQDMLWK